MLSLYLSHYFGKKVILLLDEYDTPMQEAYVNGYWEEMTAFFRSLFNSTFKTNPYLYRGVMTGITRVSKESIFSDLNNLTVITTTSNSYENSFGFTQQEVWDALNEYHLSEKKEIVKEWYDGFVFGRQRGIYNPWSIVNFLKTQRLSSYWANTSSNSLVGKLIREGSPSIKETMEDLLKGNKLCMDIDEQIIFSQLDQNDNAVWSLFLASGYLRADSYQLNEELGKEENGYVKEVKEYAQKENAKVVSLCAKVEEELSELSSLDKKEMLEALGEETSGLDKLIKATYDLLGLPTYFTVGPDEVRAWTFRKGMNAKRCAGLIHTDFEKGFIRAEVISYEDLIQYGSELKVKEAGRARLEGKDYLMQDGDICHFRFNV